MTHPYRSSLLHVLPTRALTSGSSTPVLAGITVASAGLTVTMTAAQDSAAVPFGVLTLTYLVLTAISARLDTLYRAQQTRAAIRRRLDAVCTRQADVSHIDPFTGQPYGPDEWQTYPAPSDLGMHAYDAACDERSWGEDCDDQRGTR